MKFRNKRKEWYIEATRHKSRKKIKRRTHKIERRKAKEYIYEEENYSN